MYRLLVLLFSFLFFASCQNKELVVDEKNTSLELVNGVLHYQSNPFNGLLVSYFEAASIKKKLQYKDGRKDGLEEQWYENGQLSQRRLYSNGIKIGKHLGWWENGTKKFEYHFNEKGAYEGSRKEWYQNGQLLRDFNYAEGKEIGNQRMWAENGKIRANYEVKNGERFGLIGLKKCFTVNTNSNVLQ